jgi:hypothetical protein
MWLNPSARQTHRVDTPVAGSVQSLAKIEIDSFSLKKYLFAKSPIRLMKHLQEL